MRNRRAFNRIEQHQSVKVVILSPSESKKPHTRAFSCSSEDLSVGGIQFSSRRAIGVNANLTLQISITRPNQTFLHKGRVVWMREENGGKSYRIGVFFTDEDPQAMIGWRRSVALLAKD